MNTVSEIFDRIVAEMSQGTIEEQAKTENCVEGTDLVSHDQKAVEPAVEQRPTEIKKQRLSKAERK